jgi:hypothetical protein
MFKKNQPLGTKITQAAMKAMKGGLLAEWPNDIDGPGGICIMPGQPCGGGGCTEPQPVCCYGLVCSGSNGIIPKPGTCGNGVEEHNM